MCSTILKEFDLFKDSIIIIILFYKIKLDFYNIILFSFLKSNCKFIIDEKEYLYNDLSFNFIIYIKC